MMKQGKNYSMLYNAKKKLVDKEKQKLRDENEKLLKKIKESEEENK